MKFFKSSLKSKFFMLQRVTDKTVSYEYVARNETYFNLSSVGLSHSAATYYFPLWPRKLMFSDLSGSEIHIPTYLKRY